MIDGGLSTLLRQHFLHWQLTRLESGGTARGIPDLEYAAPGGVSGWIELKRTTTQRVAFRPGQVGWLHRRASLGGRATLAIRRQPTARKFAGADELWLIDAIHALALMQSGLDQVPAACAGVGGPKQWDWSAVERFLFARSANRPGGLLDGQAQRIPADRER
jgi:hypothetical protein